MYREQGTERKLVNKLENCAVRCDNARRFCISHGNGPILAANVFGGITYHPKHKRPLNAIFRENK